MPAFPRHCSAAFLLCLLLGSLGAGAQGQSPVPRTRTYYIAADPVTWDYAPGGRDEIAGRPYTDSAFFAKAPTRAVGTAYRKVLYREYTDSTFRTLKPRPEEWQHLGFLGPLIRAVVGDTIRVVFRNNGHRPYSVHPQGVAYDKSAEGATYSDGTSGGEAADSGVPPGDTHVYLWPVPERAGPGPADGSSVLWLYRSDVEELRDLNTGLLGVMIITARGMARPDGSPRDVDREIVTAFAQVRENQSWLATANLPPRDSLEREQPIGNPLESDAPEPWFVKFTINGFVRGGMPLPALTVHRGQRVRWYVMASTNQFDFHAPHWHGNTVLVAGMRTDVLRVWYMQRVIANMVPDNVGTWLLHCHVSSHNAAGMAVRYQVVP